MHAYTPEAIRQAIDAGVKCIEHGSLMDEEDCTNHQDQKGIWLSMQPFPDELADAFPKGSNEWNKAQEVFAGNDNAYKLAKKNGLKVAWGTDVLFSRALAAKQGAILASLTRWYSPAETLTMATSTNAELLQLSGKRNPYPGVLGRRGRRRIGRSVAGRGQSAGEHRAGRRPAAQLPGDHEGREDLQEHRGRSTRPLNADGEDL